MLETVLSSNMTCTDGLLISLAIYATCITNRPMFTHSVVDGSPIGGLHQHFVSCCSDFLHVLWSKGCPSLPHVNILSSDSHHALVMARPPLAPHTAIHPPALSSNKSQHGSPKASRQSYEYTWAERLARAMA